ncbi:MAG: helix-turn-helix domain-containing protein [Planctomycetes bacterium]|nr:helix-turn-helix domain-containing protein [Planctomycetota bacterium]
MANGELIDARAAMDMLGIDENKLQTLVARGDLRAFRSAGTMKFRREDVMGLKTEKGTEPTIIIPSAGPRKPGQSGILSAIDAPPAGGSGISPAARQPGGSGISPGAPNNEQTGTIVFDDIDFVPTDDAMSTQQQTVVGSAITSGVGDAATMVDQRAVGGEQTGEMTVVDNEALDENAVSTGPAIPVGAPPATGSGPRPAAMAPARAQSRVGSSVGPAVSRVRAGVSGAATVARRTATVYEVKTAHPIMTAVLILNTLVLLFTGSVFGVMLFKGHYDYDQLSEEGSKQRIIPPYLTKQDGLGIYEGMYSGSLFGSLPGNPADPKPAGEPFSGDSSSEE